MLRRINNSDSEITTGWLHSNCMYLAFKNSVCNKCGLYVTDKNIVCGYLIEPMIFCREVLPCETHPRAISDEAKYKVSTREIIIRAFIFTFGVIFIIWSVYLSGWV